MHIAVNGGYRSPGHKMSSNATAHMWGTAADIYRIGAAIIKYNLDGYHGDLVRALADYYGGPTMATDWNHLRADAKRYVYGIYQLAVAFRDGRGPV